MGNLDQINFKDTTNPENTNLNPETLKNLREEYINNGSDPRTKY